MVYYPPGPTKITLADSKEISKENKIPSSTINIETDYPKALQIMMEGKYQEAIDLFEDDYNKEKNIEGKKYYLSQIAECYNLLGRKDFITFLNDKIRYRS